MDIEDVVDDILAHHGIKGMKWGVRRDVHPAIAHIPRKTRKEAAKDAEEFTRAKMFFGEGAGVRRRLINAKVEAKKKRDSLYSTAFDHFVKQTDFARRSTQARKERRSVDRRDRARKNSKRAGRILMRELTMLQTSIDGVEFLEHHGVKGMKWGVRKSTGAASQRVRTRVAQARSPEVTVRDRGKKLKTTGGRGLPAHSDAIAARTLGQKGKGSGLKALSNKELEAYAKRLQLEQNVKRLNYNEKGRGQKFVADFLKSKEGKKAFREVASSDAVGGRVKKHIAKRIVKASAKAAAVAAA